MTRTRRDQRQHRRKAWRNPGGRTEHVKREKRRKKRREAQRRANHEVRRVLEAHR